MRKMALILIVLSCILSCNSTQKATVDSKNNQSQKSDTVRIANDEVDYEIIIIDPGFNSFLFGQAKPRGYYSLEILEQRNQVYVKEWNNRVRLPLSYNPQLYEMTIDYDSSIRYGYEVNYLLYNYFVFFQLNYNQQLGGFVPRR